MGYLTIIIICAVAGGILANHKGRNVLGWSILCFFFGIIPLIILACLPNLRKRAAQATAIAQNTNQNATNVVVNIPGFAAPYGMPTAPAAYGYVPQAMPQQQVGPNGQPMPLPYGQPVPGYYPAAPVPAAAAPAVEVPAPQAAAPVVPPQS